ncbi:MAG: TIGR04222 domain-containing membrane protein [Planctomycetota bacterium]
MVVLGFVSDVLDMRGPDFLGLFVALTACAFIASLIVAYVLPRLLWHDGAGRAGELAKGLSAFEAAYLVGGLQRLMETAVTSLYQQKSITANSQGSLSVKSAPQSVTDEVESDVYAAIRARGQRADIKKAAAFRGVVIKDRLVREGMLLSFGQRVIAKLLTAFPFAVVLLLGLAKINVGISRDKPVAFLVILCLLSVVVAFFILKLIRKSGTGSAVVGELQNRDEQPSADEAGVDAEAWTCAVFGSAMVFGSIPSMNLFFNPPSSSSSSGSGCSSDTGCGSSCGSGCGGCGD